MTVDRFVPTNGDKIHYLDEREQRNPETPFSVHCGAVSRVKYVGVSLPSVEIHFTDGSGIRITSSDFSDLKIAPLQSA